LIFQAQPVTTALAAGARRLSQLPRGSMGGSRVS